MLCVPIPEPVSSMQTSSQSIFAIASYKSLSSTEISKAEKVSTLLLFCWHMQQSIMHLLIFSVCQWCAVAGCGRHAACGGLGLSDRTQGGCALSALAGDGVLQLEVSSSMHAFQFAAQE
jgi:hypothetical protein